MSGVQPLRSNPPDASFKNGTTVNGDSVTKVGDSSSVSEGENSSFDKLGGDRITHFQYSGVRFTPSVLEFIDAFQGKQFTEKVFIQNVGRNPVLIRIGEPTSFIFQLKKPSRRCIFLASGNSISRTITYTYHSDDLVQRSRIPIYINGRQIEYPIVVKKAVPELEVNPPKIDFGTINLGSEVKTLELKIHNVGGTRTKYEIDVGKNDLDLVVNPMKGTVKAKHQVKVTVELMGMREGEFYKEIWIKTNETPIRVPVYVEVVRPRLLVIYPNGTEELSAIDFRPTFLGTQKAMSFVLKNRGGETALFITVGDVNGEHKFLTDARKNDEVFNFFSLTAEEGRLEPHESRVLTALFRPEASNKTRGWHHQEKMDKKSQREHVVFFTLSRVHCIERKEIEKAYAPFYSAESHKSSLNVKSKLGSSNLIPNAESGSQHMPAIIDAYLVQESGFRLCLRGISVKPEILLQPSRFYFGELRLEQTEQRVLTVTNKSIIRVKCVIPKKMNVRVRPKEFWIGPEKSYEFMVAVTPTSAGIFKHVVKVQILGDSDVVYEFDKPLKVVAEYPVIISYTAVNLPKPLVPKIGLGISPIITDDAGINKELVTFNNADKVPYATMLLSLNEEFKPIWMRMKSADLDKAMIALPNDRPRGFQTWPKNKICRTIFKGWPRYAPPKDPLYTLSSKEEIAKSRNAETWTNYLLIMREIRTTFYPEEECQDVLKPCYMKRFRDYFMRENYKALQLTGHSARKKPVGFNLQNCLVPLSPMYLSHVTVEPKMINFGMVAVKHAVSASLKIKNHNNFPIAIKFIPGNSAVTVDEGTVIVHLDSEKNLKLWFELGILGRYYGFLNYVINGSHEFKITISAFVMPRTLKIDAKALVFNNYPSHQAFQPRTLFLGMENWLQAPITYKFQFSTDSPYYAILREGTIPPNSKLYSEIVFGLHHKKPLMAEVKVVSESGENQLLKISQMFRKLPVGFITNRIDLKDIPLNLKTKVTPIVENECFHDVTFEVLNGSPIPGVTVEPKFGIIKARSFFPLDVQIQIPVVLQFTFEIQMIVQTSNRISVKISGNVVLPMIRIKPSVINMRKICAQSLDTVMICVENSGTTPSEVDIDFKTCPEYKVVKGKSHLYLNPKQATSVVIMFEPKDAARFVFYLPVIINNILGPPMMQETETEYVHFYLSDLEKMYDVYGEIRDTEKTGEKVPLAVISCTVASSLITVTPVTVTFQQSEVFQPLVGESSHTVNDYDINVYFPPKTITISNDSGNDVTFCLRNDDLGQSNESPFDLQPVIPDTVEYRLKSMKATLRPGEQITLRATFAPKKTGLYTVEVPVYVRGYNNGVVYCYITLTGELNKPNLIPEAEEIHFYPIPLNVSTELTFKITAENYHKTDVISCVICQPMNREYTGADTLKTVWIDAPEVTDLNGRQDFSIQIIFSSSIPVALRCYLVFVDSARNFCSVLLTAVADNSSLTTHSFLNMCMSKYKIIRQDCTPLVWKADEHPVLTYPFDRAQLYKNEKIERKSNDMLGSSINHYTMTLDKGPIIVVQGDMSRSNVGLVLRKKKFEGSTTGLLQDSQNTSSGSTLACTIKSFHSKGNITEIESTYPYYPKSEGIYKNHCDSTLLYVERWIYEVVMRCDQYFMIPMSFKIFKKSFINVTKGRNRKQKDVTHFLAEIYGEELISILKNADSNLCSTTWARRLFNFYNDILYLLESQGCFLPHVRAEYLLPYDDYCTYVQNIKDSDIIYQVHLEPKASISLKLSHNTLNSKPKAEADDFQIQETTSSVSGKEWLASKSVFDTLTIAPPTEVISEKEESSDVTDKGMMTSHSKPMDFVVTPEEEFSHTFEMLDEIEFNQRSTQAWLDVIIQIFRHVVLKKIVYKNTIPEVQVIEPKDKVPVEVVEMSKISLYGGGKEPMIDTYSSNLYNVQERMLLLWLNHHLNIQKKQMWVQINYNGVISNDKIINNFHKDLCDSLALISVTASYCPYVIPEYFHDCFPKPDTLEKYYHNAARLVQAWRELNIGLTVEANDIVNPNSIFMLMVIAQLYETLPTMHPRYLACFEAPLSSHQTKRFLVQSELGRLVLNVKFLGEDSKYFKMHCNPQLELQKGKLEDIKVTFVARKIKKVKATLLLSGCEESPYFGKSLAFFMEGQLTELTESEKLNFSAPLYKVICTEIAIKPPYSGTTLYEVWYGTVKPVLSESSDLVTNSKPWSKIWFRKVCRRLFINQNEVMYIHERKRLFLKVTIACFTHKERSFWLLFRSKTGDFIVRIKIKSKGEKVPWKVVNCWYPETWPPCLCMKTDKGPRINWSDMRSCPLLTVVKIPSKNGAMWDALRTMFLKCVLPQEKTFWAEHFEKDIGLCIIRWLLSPDEEEEVVDEFAPLLQTHIKYTLSVVGSKRQLQLPPQIEIKDVRQANDTIIPVHIKKGSDTEFVVDMTSESQIEVRTFKVLVNSLNQMEEGEEEAEADILSGMCEPCEETVALTCRKPRKFAKLF